MILLAYSGVIQTLHRGQQLILVGEEIAIWSVNDYLFQVAATNAHKSASQSAKRVLAQPSLVLAQPSFVLAQPHFGHPSLVP